ncbi:hypothetical protein Tco_0669507, partial [Tanacetum coccineum]
MIMGPMVGLPWPVSPGQRLLAGAVLNDEVRGEPVPTLPFVTSSV